MSFRLPYLVMVREFCWLTLQEMARDNLGWGCTGREFGCWRWPGLSCCPQAHAVALVAAAGVVVSDVLRQDRPQVLLAADESSCPLL